MGGPVSMFADLGRAVSQMMSDGRFMRVLLWSVLLTILALAAVFWVMMILLGWVLPSTFILPFIGEVSFVDNLVSWAAVGVMLALSVVLMVPAAAVVVGFFLDSIVSAVEARYYPGLPVIENVSIGQQVIDSLRFFGLVVVANLLALVIYLLVAPLAPFIFWVVNGYLLGREYFTLVAMRRLGPDGARRLWKRNLAQIWLAGTAMTIPLSVPLLNLIVPVLGVAVFTHRFHRMIAPSDYGAQT